MFRKKIAYKKSKKMFTKTAKKFHKKNNSSVGVMRGGYRA